jgi:hypothetical protein
MSGSAATTKAETSRLKVAGIVATYALLLTAFLMADKLRWTPVTHYGELTIEDPAHPSLTLTRPTRQFATADRLVRQLQMGQSWIDCGQGGCSATLHAMYPQAPKQIALLSHP